MTAKKTFSKKYQKVFKATSAQNKIQSDKNKKIIFKEVSDKHFLKRLEPKIVSTATRAKNHFRSDKRQKAIFKEKGAKKYFQSDNRPRNILKATNTTNTFQSNKCQKK